MIISKEKIEITTFNAVIGLIIGISTIFAIFYNAKADASNKVDSVSERVAKLETAVPLIQSDVKDIKSVMSDVSTLVHLVKVAYPKY